MAFLGWSEAALEFYDGLEADNSKSYWQANKARYEQLVRAPMEALLTELAEEFGDGKIFRPNRDVRFSADKAPYKTNIGATLGAGGYVQLSADGLAAARGMYVFAPDQLLRYRRAVADEHVGPDLSKIVDDARAAGLTVTGHDQLKSAPRGYPKDHPRIELLRLKGLITWKEWPVEEWMCTPMAKTQISDVLRASEPLQRWVDKHVGPSDAPDRFGR